jgi:hypothetical protein
MHSEKNNFQQAMKLHDILLSMVALGCFALSLTLIATL